MVFVLCRHRQVGQDPFLKTGKEPLHFDPKIGFNQWYFTVKFFHTILRDLIYNRILNTFDIQDGLTTCEKCRIITDPPVIDGKLDRMFFAGTIKIISPQAPNVHMILVRNELPGT